MTLLRKSKKVVPYSQGASRILCQTFVYVQAHLRRERIKEFRSLDFLSSFRRKCSLLILLCLFLYMVFRFMEVIEEIPWSTNLTLITFFPRGCSSKMSLSLTLLHNLKSLTFSSFSSNSWKQKIDAKASVKILVKIEAIGLQ